MITITPETRLAELTDDERAQLTDDQAAELMDRDLVDPATGDIIMGGTDFDAAVLPAKEIAAINARKNAAA